MNIPEAIANNKEMISSAIARRSSSYPFSDKELKALQLGIEALERQKEIRGKSYTQVSIDDVWKPLPSETE